MARAKSPAKLDSDPSPDPSAGLPPASPPALEEGEDLNFRDPLQLRYVLVDDLVLLEGNPKLHDIGKISASIVENGFRDPIAWDATLNGGKGGIVEGNGRAETLKHMQDQGCDLPRGIAQASDGRWAAPVLFGVDSRSEKAAKRYSLDHNSLVLAGGTFTALDTSRLYDQEGYVSFLEDLAKTGDLPLTVDGEDLDLLIELLNNPGGSGGDGDALPGSGDKGKPEPPEDELPPGADDRGIPYVSKYAVAIECEDESSQEETYRELTELGYKCKVLTL